MKSCSCRCCFVFSSLYWSVRNAKWGQSRCVGLGVSRRLPVVRPVCFPKPLLPYTPFCLRCVKRLGCSENMRTKETVGPRLSFVDVILNFYIQISSLYSLWHWCSKHLPLSAAEKSIVAGAPWGWDCCPGSPAQAVLW